ncbi:MAG TPA: response regulator transcription factor, partial [Actinomycetales bacterium]|nr:response regulator transcription factor [Actinomycetales bacterium]
MIRVVVVDDQPLVRMGMRTLLESEPDTELVGEAPDGRAGVDVVRRTRPDVVLMDIRMPVQDGLEALAEITADAALAGVRVVMLTTFELDEYVFEALRNGASGFVLKDSPPAELLRAVRVVASGESLLSPSVTRTARSSSGGGESFSTNPLAPLRNASKTYSSSSNVVSITTRTPASAASAVISARASRPSCTGIRMSIRTTSGRVRRTTSTPARPSGASPTSSVSGSDSSRVRIPIRTRGWSSTTTTRITT